MSAEDCLKHQWLKRKNATVSPSISPMEVTKDNLKQFVDRWNEHPNSPYVFEVTSHVISPNYNGRLQLSDSLESLVGLSPSPCGSLASSTGSDNAFFPIDTSNNDVLVPPNLDHVRRASDSTTCVLKSPDVTERINLAEEIRKLSDKLFQLSNISTSVTKNNTTLDELSLPSLAIAKNKEPPIFQKSVPIKIEKSRLATKDHFEAAANGVPWRRNKNRLNHMSRDVPLAFRNSKIQFHDQFETCNGFSSTITDTSSPNGTKNLLLRLLEQWDGPHVPARSNNRHGSVSNELAESDSIGQRSISSLNNFFQSRQTSKKVTSFHHHHH